MGQEGEEEFGQRQPWRDAVIESAGSRLEVGQTKGDMSLRWCVQSMPKFGDFDNYMGGLD